LVRGAARGGRLDAKGGALRSQRALRTLGEADGEAEREGEREGAGGGGISARRRESVASFGAINWRAAARRRCDSSCRHHGHLRDLHLRDPTGTYKRSPLLHFLKTGP